MGSSLDLMRLSDEDYSVTSARCATRGDVCGSSLLPSSKHESGSIDFEIQTVIEVLRARVCEVIVKSRTISPAGQMLHPVLPEDIACVTSIYNSPGSPFGGESCLARHFDMTR